MISRSTASDRFRCQILGILGENNETIEGAINSDLSIDSERSLLLPNIGNTWREHRDNRGIDRQWSIDRQWIVSLPNIRTINHTIAADLFIDSDRPLSLPNTGNSHWDRDDWGQWRRRLPVLSIESEWFLSVPNIGSNRWDNRQWSFVRERMVSVEHEH